MRNPDDEPSLHLWGYRRRLGPSAASLMLAILFGGFAVGMLVVGLNLDDPRARWPLIGTAALFGLIAVIGAAFALPIVRRTREGSSTTSLETRLGLIMAVIGGATAVAVLLALGVLALTGGFS